MDNNHRFGNSCQSVMSQGVAGAPIEIGDYSWIGGHAVILPSVSVGRSAIVGAGAVVTKNVPALAIVAGVPAKVIGWRKENDG